MDNTLFNTRKYKETQNGLGDLKIPQ